MRPFFILLSIISCLSVQAQERATIENLKTQRKKERDYARKSIEELSQGALLVRLDFKEKKIAHLEQYGDTAEATKIREKQLKKNVAIISAFENNFTFCPVFFFAMSDSRALLEGGLDSVIFYNTIGEKDSTIRVSAEYYFIAEFGQIEQDTTVYYSGTVIDTEGEKRQRNTYYGGRKNGRYGLIIRNKNFVQLRDPFPYFVKCNPLGSSEKGYYTPVKIMNKNLWKYRG